MPANSYKRSLRDEFPLRVIVNGEDVSFIVDENFSFSNSDPGGFEAASIPIPFDKPYLKRGMNVRIESGLRTVWEGRIKEIQRSLGAKTLIQCQGYRAVLKEQSLAEIFVDRDLTRWTGASAARQLEIIEAGDSYNGGGGVVADPVSGQPALLTNFTTPWSVGENLSEAVYNANGIPIASVYYTFLSYGMGGPATYSIKIVIAADDKWAEPHTIVTLTVGAATLSGTVTATTPEPIAVASLHAAGADTSSSGVEKVVFWRVLAVYGTHGLTKRGAAPSGFYTSDIATFVVGKAPAVQAGIIETASQIVIPHSSYVQPVTLEQIIDDMAKFAGWHWGVWESLTYMLGDQRPRVDFRAGAQPGSPTAWCWRNQCEALDVREDIENLYNSARVTYTEPSGQEGSVEVQLANPTLDALGESRQVILSLGQGTKAAAEAWGLTQLTILADQAQRTGHASIVEAIQNMQGAAMPAWMLRAGIDRLRIPDLPCSDVFGAKNDLPITRVECVGGSQGLVTSIEFGNAVNLIETLAAQLQANLIAAGI